MPNVVKSVGYEAVLKEHEVQLTDRELRRLHLEARQTYREYGRIRGLPRGDRAHPVLRDQLSRLRARYRELERLLNGAQILADAPGGDDVYHFDISRFEPVDRPSFHQAAYRRSETDRPWYSRVVKLLPPLRFSVSLVLLCVVLGAALLVANQNLGFYGVTTSSMEPTLIPDDRLISYSSTLYERGQVVVIRGDPKEFTNVLVKRIVGLPGDVVAVRNGTLIVNGHRVEEPYLFEKMSYSLAPIRVGSDEVFVLGDNRNQSHDSHIWKHGLPIDNIMGSVRQIYSPRSRIDAPIAYTDAFADVEARGRGAERPMQRASAS